MTCHPERSEGSRAFMRYAHVSGGSLAAYAARDDDGEARQ